MATKKSITRWGCAIKEFPKSPNYKGTQDASPWVFMLEDGYQCYCEPSITTFSKVRKGYWYQIEIGESDKNLPYYVIRIIPNTESKDRPSINADKKSVAHKKFDSKFGEAFNGSTPAFMERDWEKEIVNLLTTNRHWSSFPDIFSRLTNSSVSDSDLSEEAKKDKNNIQAALNKLHNEGAVYKVSLMRRGTLSKARNYWGLNADDFLKKIDQNYFGNQKHEAWKEGTLKQ